MNPGLLHLLRVETLGTARRLRRRLRGVKGFIAVCAVGLVLALLIGSLFLAPVDSSELLRAYRTQRRAIAPFGLLMGIIAVGVNMGSFFFRPSEIHFLFPAPITRWQLLLFNILCRWRVQILSGLFMSLFLMHWTPRPYAAIAGSVLYMMFIQVFAQLSGVFFATLDLKIARQIRRFVPLVVVVGLAGGLYWLSHALPADEASTNERTFSAMHRLATLPGIEQAATVMWPFSETMFAESFGAFLLWGSLAIGMIAAGLWLLWLSDAVYQESAIATAERMQKRLERIRQGGGVFAASAPRKSRIEVPPLPRFGGAGPIAWRQLVEITRNSRSVLILLAVAAIYVTISGTVVSGTDTSPSEQAGSAWQLIMNFVIMSVAFSGYLTFDLRRDIDRFHQLKSLPISNFAMALGQSLPATVVLTLVHALLFASLPFIFSDLPARIYLWLVPMLFLNWNAASLDNWLFLVMPYRMVARDPGEFQFTGKVALISVLKILSLMLIGGFALGIAAGVWKNTGKHLPVALAIATLLLIGSGLLLTWRVGIRYGRFDVSQDMPD